MKKYVSSMAYTLWFLVFGFLSLCIVRKGFPMSLIEAEFVLPVKFLCGAILFYALFHLYFPILKERNSEMLYDATLKVLVTSKFLGCLFFGVMLGGTFLTSRFSEILEAWKFLAALTFAAVTAAVIFLMVIFHVLLRKVSS